MRAQSFQHFSRKTVLKLQDQLSQHDQSKNLNQRHLRYAHWFKSTNQHIATVGSSKPQPCPAQDVCNFCSSKQKSLVTNQLSGTEFSQVIRRLCVCFDSVNRFLSVLFFIQNKSLDFKDEKEAVSFPGEKMLVSLNQQWRDSSRILVLSIFNEG